MKKDLAGELLAKPKGIEYTAPSVHRGRGKILVVSSQRVSGNQLTTILTSRGYQAEAVMGEGTALRKVARNPYDLVLFDLQLSKPRSLATLERILKAGLGLSIAIVAEPGLDDEAYSKVLKKGVYACLARPIREQALDLLLRNAIERTRLLAENTSLKQETLCDDLTNAYNRRFMEVYLDEELERARRYRRPFSLLFFDVDHLKVINDHYGHMAGSRVLRQVAALIGNRLRKSDKIFRFGGDEFVIALPETDVEGAFRVAQRLRQALKGHRFMVKKGISMSITASFGVATFPRDGASKDELLRHADRAMYRIKETTRDGVGA